MHSTVGVAQGWGRLAQALLGLAVLAGLSVALSQAMFGVTSASLRIVHVSLALLLWPLALLAAAVGQGLAGWPGGLARFGLFLGGVGAVLSALVALLSDSRDAYSSALPILRHPMHGAAMGLFLLGILVVFAARLGARVSRLPASGTISGGMLWYPLLPLAVAGWSAWYAWSATVDLEGPVRLSYAFWGPANLVPFLFSVLLMNGWLWLVQAGAAGWRWRTWTHLCMLLAVAPVLVVIPIQLELPITDPEYFAQFDRLAMVGVWPAALLLFGSVLPRVRHAWRAGRRGDAMAVLGSAAMLFLGSVIAWGGDDTGTIYRAQVHLSAGALLLVSHVLGRRWGTMAAPLDDRTGSLAETAWRPGVIVLAFVLLAAGFGLYGAAELLGLALPEQSYGIARAGGVFAALLLVAMLWLPGVRGVTSRVGEIRRRLVAVVSAIDVRARAAIATVATIALVGGVIAMLPDPGQNVVSAVGKAPDDMHEHVVDKRREEVRLRFEQGVAMLHARRHDEAATAFHRVLQLAPELPEAHVNMGFAMLGIRDYKVARDFFEGAIELRTEQLNAYYGLALAYEGLGNIEGAIGAMRTYQHLTAPDDPFLPEAVRKLQDLQGRRTLAPAPASAQSRGQ